MITFLAGLIGFDAAPLLAYGDIITSFIGVLR